MSKNKETTEPNQIIKIAYWVCILMQIFQNANIKKSVNKAILLVVVIYAFHSATMSKKINYSLSLSCNFFIYETVQKQFYYSVAFASHHWT